ncbi:MAG: flagellar biosynthesis protein FliQ, partial [Acetobacteraceae bacterium]
GWTPLDNTAGNLAIPGHHEDADLSPIRPSTSRTVRAMNDADIAVSLRDGMLVMLKLGGPPLMVALGVGLMISLLQAVTQINEATLAFVPKVLAIGVALVLLGPFMLSTLSDYTRILFDRLVAIGGS